MQTRLDLYVPFIYLLAAVLYAWLGLFAWRKRPAAAVTHFAWTMLGLFIWSFAYSLELFLPSLPIVLFLTKIEYIGIVSIPVFLLFFALEYTGKSHLLTLRTRLLIWVIPLLTLILVWTNGSHHLMWSMETISETNGLKLLVVRYGVFFWVHTLFSYTLTSFAGILLIMEMVQRPVLHDITERKKSEIALSRRETMMSAIGLAAEKFLKESTWEHNIPGVLEKIGQAANVSRVYVFMNYSDAKGVIYASQCYEWSAPEVMPQIDSPNLQHVPLREAGFSRWEEQLSKGKPIHGILREFPESERNILRDQNILSLALMPIFVDHQWWGFIGFDECTYERNWTGTELEALHITASIFGSAEARARTEQRLIRRQQALSLLQDIVSKSLQAKSLKYMAIDIVDQLTQLIHANDCFITLWSEDSTQTYPLTTHGTSGDTYLSLQPVSGEYTLTELALHLGHTLIVNDAYQSPYLDYEIAKQCPSRSLIVLPLIAEKNKLGALILSFEEYHLFQPEEISICEQAVNLMALAFEKFKAVEQAQQRAATSETLRKAGAAVTETLEKYETVSRILEQLKQVVPYDTASIQLLNENELEIIGGSGFGDPKAVVGMRFPVPGENPNTIVIETGEPYLLPEIGDVYDAFKEPPHNHIRSWLGVPLIFQERIIGLLAIDGTSPNQFTQENITLAVAFADQVSVALENSRNYEKAQTQAITDALTGVYNRRGLFQIGEFEFSHIRRIDHPFSVLMIDVDHFKRVNDTYGHATGDQTLRGLTERSRTLLRAVDMIGRYGGEEFVILLPETSLEAGRLVAERLRQSIKGEPFATDAGPLRITVSIGVAEATDPDTLDTLIERADAALYKAKAAGRNCVVVSETPQAHSQT